MKQIWVSDRDGWLRAFPLGRTLIHIGSDDRCDIVLNAQRGGGVSGRHIQLVLPGNGKPGKLINLGDSEVRVGKDQTNLKSIVPRASSELVEGQVLRIGDFTLWFDDKLPGLPVSSDPIVALPAPQVWPALAAPQTATPMPGVMVGTATALLQPAATIVPVAPAAIATRISLPNRNLSIDRPLEGALVVRNAGSKTGAQFRIELSGLQPQCYELGAGPVLFPNAEREVPLRILHPGTNLLMAGPRQFTVRVTSPLAYPGEVASITHVLQVDPVYRHRVEVKS